VSVCLSVCLRVFVDRSLASQRRHVFHAGAMRFDDARMECVSYNGDLPSIENDADLDYVISNVTAAPASAAGNSSSTTGLRYNTAQGRSHVFCFGGDEQ